MNSWGRYSREIIRYLSQLTLSEYKNHLNEKGTGSSPTTRSPRFGYRGKRLLRKSQKKKKGRRVFSSNEGSSTERSQARRAFENPEFEMTRTGLGGSSKSHCKLG